MYIFLLLILGVFAFSKTFHLAIFGDEWQVLWIVKNSVVTTGQWDLNINQTIGLGYKMGALLMYLLTEYFGYDGKAIYIFSFITRFLAALTLFYFLRKRECSNKAAFLGSLLFLITPIGLQATDWAKNFTSYISIIFFLLCINSIYTLKSWKKVLFFFLSFSVSIYINPIRAPGIILTTTSLLIFQYIFNKNVFRKGIIFSLFCSSVVGFILFKMNSFSGFTLVQQPIEKLFGSIGAALIPQPSNYYLCLLTATLLLWKRYMLNKRYLLLTLAFHIPVIVIFFNALRISNGIKFAVVGVYFTIFMISTFIIELVNKRTSEALKIGLAFMLIVFSLIAPLLAGTLVIDPTHRYLIYPALSLPIILAFLFNQNTLINSKDKLSEVFKFRSIYLYVPLLFLVMFYLSLKSEIDKLYINHNQDTAKIIWQQITPYFDNYDFKNHRAVVFIDTNNGAIVHDTVTFGFGYHMGYIYKIWVSDINESYNRLPVVVDSLTDFTSLITDGKVAKKYLGKDADFVFPKAESFYFKIDGLKVSRIIDTN